MAKLLPKPTHVQISFGVPDENGVGDFFLYPLPQGPAGIDDVLRNVKRLLYQYGGLECPTCHR
jgi:hypothetical protein